MSRVHCKPALSSRPFSGRRIEGFAELLGGSVSVESEVGKGSTFTVRVPVEYQEPG